MDLLLSGPRASRRKIGDVSNNRWGNSGTIPNDYMRRPVSPVFYKFVVVLTEEDVRRPPQDIVDVLRGGGNQKVSSSVLAFGKPDQTSRVLDL